ncbi:MAG: MBL fold metallo-hydrolase, partial [Nitrospinota bacterium]
PHSYCSDPDADPKHIRTRASILIETNDLSLLVDTSMDFRQQMLASRVKRVDAVLFTHSHADHIFGLPDIRSYSYRQGSPIDIYGSKETIETVRRSFEYIFSPPSMKGGGIAEISPHIVDKPFKVGGVPILPIPVIHGSLTGCIGFRIGTMAYIPDAKKIPHASMEMLTGLDILILDALKKSEHSTHLSIDESVRIAQKLNPQRTFFTHMSHDVNYLEEEALLPKSIRFAYDTLKIGL